MHPDPIPLRPSQRVTIYSSTAPVPGHRVTFGAEAQVVSVFDTATQYPTHLLDSAPGVPLADVRGSIASNFDREARRPPPRGTKS